MRSILISVLVAVISVNAAVLKDVRFSCNSSSCGLEFPFASDKGLPEYVQKFDSANSVLRVAFSKTSSSLENGYYIINEYSPWIQSVEVSADKSKELLHLDFKCGPYISTDRNAVELRNKTNFVMSFRVENSEENTQSWTLATIPVKSKKSSIEEASVAENFSVMPPHISSVFVQRNAEWEEMMIVLDSRLSPDVAPVITDSTVELESIKNAPSYSTVFQTANSSFAKGFAWTNSKLVIYLHHGKKPVVMVMKNRILLQAETEPGRLYSWQVLPTGLKSASYFLPSYEPLSLMSADFASRVEKKRVTDPSQTIQVKRSDASYIVTEDIASLFPSPYEGKPLEALEFGDRLKLLGKQNPFYKVRYNNKEGYVYQRDVLLEAHLTTTQKDKLRRLKKETPGSVDSVAAKFGWKDSDRIIYSSFGFRDPFIEVRSSVSDGINLDNLTLVGVVFENEMPMALLSDNKIKGQSYILHEGDTVKNGKILKISKDSVLFLLQEYGVSRRYTMSLPNKHHGGN